MRTTNLTLLAAMLLSAMAVESSFGATTLVISDTYGAVSNNVGFALGQGLNSGINPPTTRLTGAAAANLRYIRRGNKGDTVYWVTGSKAKIQQGSQSGRFTISANGTDPFSFATALGLATATPATPVVYDVAIKMQTDGASGRMTFAYGTVEDGGGYWSFGVQILKSGTQYGVYRRMKTGATGLASEVNTLTTTSGTAGSDISIVMRVTDAGTETTPPYHSGVQLSVDGGATFIYDTATDSTLVNGFRFENGNRYVSFDQAGNDGADYYDNFSITIIPPPPPPETRTWTGGGTDGNWSTADNWFNSTIPGTGELVAFNGTIQQANTNNIDGLTVAGITFSNGGFNLYGTTLTNSGGITNLAGVNTLWGDLAWSSNVAKAWSVAAGSELVLNNTTTVEVNGDHSFYGGGTLRQQGDINIGQQGLVANPAFSVKEGVHLIDARSFISRGSYRVGSMAPAPAGATTILTNGATLYVTAVGGSTRVGDSANSVASKLLMYDSTYKSDGTPLYIPYVVGATGQVAQTGGLVSCPITFCRAGTNMGTYAITNGTLETIYVQCTNNDSDARIYFNNALLRTAAGAGSTFMSGLDDAEIQPGGLTVEAQTDITISQKMQGAGALTKIGGSSVKLSGNNTYTGGTYVKEGKLILPTGKTYKGTLQVTNGAALEVSVGTAPGTVNGGTLDLGGSDPGFVELILDLGTSANPTVPIISVTNLYVWLNTIVTLNVPNGLHLTTGPIVLIDYQGQIGGGGFDAFVLANYTNIIGAELVNNIENSSIDLNITNAPGLLWTGANSSDWDYSTQNWIDEQSGQPSAFYDSAAVDFRDGAVTGEVNLSANQPSCNFITLSNDTLPYVWTGGQITTPTLRKNGPGTVTRIMSASDGITNIELNAGYFIVSNATAVSFTSKLTDATAGTGTFVKRGAGKLTMSAGNASDTYKGKTIIQDGIVALGDTHALGDTTAKIAITNGGTLELNGHQPKQPTTVSGDGVNGQGAIIDSDPASDVEENLIDVTLAGDTTFGCLVVTGRWDIRINSTTDQGPGLKGNGHNLAKVGAGMVSIAIERDWVDATPHWALNLGDILINAGNLAFAGPVDLGNPSAALTVQSGAILQLYDLGLTNPIRRTITMTSARINASASATHTNVLNGPVQLTGANTVWCNGAHLIVNGSMGGMGSLGLFAADGGTLLLNGINTYPGDTTVTNGTFGGTGVLAGNLVMLGGTNAPGADGVGTFTVNGNATLAGTTTMELNRSLAPKSDQLVVGGTLTFGGTLLVKFGAGAPSPQAGDVYQLFSKGGGGSFNGLLLPDISGLPGNLSWNYTKLTTEGKLSVDGTVTTPPSIGSVGLNGNDFTFSGTGGIEGNTYYVVTSPNVEAVLATWLPIYTNVFGPGGTFSFTTNIVGGAPKAFFRLQVP